MHYPHVPGQSIVSGEFLLFCAQLAANLVFAIAVNRIVVPSEVVAAGEDGVARFACAGIDFLTFVRAGLVVA